MKKWSRLTALVLAFAIVLSTVSGALAQIEIDHGEFQTWVADTKEAEGLSGVISIDEGGEVLVAPSTFTGELNQGPLYTSESTQNLSAYAQGSAPTVDVALGQYSKVELAAPSAGQWQVYLSAADLWVNITGETGSTFALTYAKVKGMIDADGAAKIRCLMGENATETVNVTVRYEDAAVVVNSTATVSQPMVMSARTVAADAQAEGDPENKTYNVVVNYVFENNEIVADPYTANLAAGSNFSATVTFPVVQGYLAYLDNAADATTSMQLGITNIQANVTHTVTYKPTDVNYTVVHYLQNVANDNYTLDKTETLQGLTKSTVPEVARKYAGFYALLYERPEIAADGSTVVEVYYDRNYYLMNFELGENAYGTEPVYARYGASIGNVPNPTRPGYTFKGWTLKGTEATLPDTMPAENRTYVAVWEANDTAKVTVVFWGENANDENYSYLSTSEIELEPGTQYVYGGATLTCTQEAHKHVDACMQCTEKEHIHTAECYTFTCDEQEHTKHTPSCYAGASTSTASPGMLAPNNPSEGQVYRRAINGNKYIYIDGEWYGYTGSTGDGAIAPTTCTPHVHTDYTGKCYTLTCDEHVHTSGCFKCGKTAHTHNADCFTNDPAYPVASERYLWTFAGSDVVTVAADGSTVVNVYYDRTEFTLNFTKNNSTVKTIKEKWGADIHSEFPIKDNNGTIQWTVPSTSQTMAADKEFASLDTMPAENITFKYYTSADSVTLHYYVEVLPGETGTYSHGGKNFKSYKDIDIQSGVYLTYTEEFHDILGFKQWWSDPAFDKHEKGGRTSTVYNDCVLCYTRNGFDIVYFNPTTQIKADENVPYQKPLTTYYWEPTADKAPAQYEPGSVKFDGWYLNPECTGEKFDFTKQTMPAGPNNENGEVALSLYAKWVPVTHTVEFYLDSESLATGTKIGDSHPDQTVNHGQKLPAVPADPDNGDYEFVGWFYQDENGEEKAFDFENMPINRDMKVYGKWSSNVLKEYSIYFKVQGTDTEIADPITGSALAGVTKTFDAKGGTDLYNASESKDKQNYEEGYFPIVKSHSLTLDIEDDSKNTFTFWYVQKEAVPYTVYYVTENQNAAGTLKEIKLDGDTYYIVSATKEVNDNRKAVVTETFEPVSGYLPDAYQKRLVVDGTEGADNKIIFFYTVDTQHAYYKITHYTENLDGATWTEYATSQAVGDIGTRYTADALDISGFSYSETKYFVDGTEVTSDITEDGAKLTAEGLEINLYYVRNEYPYEVQYLEYGTNKPLTDEPKTGSAKYGHTVTENAIAIAGYELVDAATKSIIIAIEEDNELERNIIRFYYQTLVDLIVAKNAPVTEYADGSKIDSAMTAEFTVTMVDKDGDNLSGTYKYKLYKTDAADPVSSELTLTNGGTINVPGGQYAKFDKQFPQGAKITVTETTSSLYDTSYTFTHAAGTTFTAGNVAQLAELTADGGFVAFQNVLKTSPVTITKTVAVESGNVPADYLDDPFTFTVKGTKAENTYGYTITKADGSSTTGTVAGNGTATITLASGEQVVFHHIPHGETLTVTETNVDADLYKTTYSTDGSTYTEGTSVNVAVDGEETVAFKNTLQHSKLSISKTIVKANDTTTADIDTTQAFEFTITGLKNGTYTYKVGSETKTLTIANGTGTISLKHGETAVIDEVLIGSTVTVAETAVPYYNVDKEQVQVTIGATANINLASFTNTYTKYKTGSIDLNKQVKDSTFTEGSKRFTFTVELSSDSDAVKKQQFAEWAEELIKTQDTFTLNEAKTILTVPMTVGYETKTVTETLSGLPLGVYNISETAVTGYNKSGEGSVTVTVDNASTDINENAPAITITNTAAGTIEIPVVKLWEDNDNLANIRPGQIEVQLVGEVVTVNEGKEVRTAFAHNVADIAIVANDGQWTGKFENVPKFDPNGNLVAYTVLEKDVANYVATYLPFTVENTAGWQITNTIIPGKLKITKSNMELEESAIFTVEGDNQTFTVVLRNGSATIAGLKPGATFTVTENNGWSKFYTVDDGEKEATIVSGETVPVSFKNTKHDQWLHDEDFKKNVFGNN